MLLPLIRDFPTKALFSDLLEETTNSAYLPLDIKEDTDKYVILADLPGVDRNSVSIDLINSGLEISVTTKEVTDKGTYILKERKFNNIRRLIYLGKDVNKESIGAKLENGVLTIEVLKDKPAIKRIEIN